MRNKKVVIFFAIIVLFISLFSLNVFALDNNMLQAEIEVSSLSTQPGKSVDVSIAIKNNPGVSAMTFSITYGANINLEKVVFNDTLGGQTGVSETLDSPAVIQWVNAFDVWNEDGVFATLTFSVADNAEYYSYSNIVLEYDPDNVYVSEGTTETNVDLTISNGRIDILPLAGDINDDGKVGSKDVTRLFQYQANWNVSVNKYAIDVNGDKKVNSKDITRLFQYLANWDVQIFIDDAPTQHEHEYSDWVYKDETTHSRSCSCGDTQIGEHAIEDGVLLDNGNVLFVCTQCLHEFLIEKELETYFVIFMDTDESILSVTSFTENTSVQITCPDYLGKKNRRFVGWDIDPNQIQTEAICEDLVIHAIDTPEYFITFFDANGQIIRVLPYAPEVDDPSVIQYPNLEDIEEGYTVSWDLSIEALQVTNEDAFVHSTIIRNLYQVVFHDYDGSELSSEYVLHNLSVAAPLNVTKWYFDFANDVGKKFVGWKATKKNGSEMTVLATEDWDGSIDRITEKLDFFPVYEIGCDSSTLILSLTSDNKLNISLLIPKGYQVNAISFKFHYDLKTGGGIQTFGYQYADSMFVDLKGEHSVFEINEREKFFTYYFVTSPGKMVNVNNSYDIMTVQLTLTTGKIYQFSNEMLSEIFALDSSESKVIYQAGTDTLRTEMLHVVYETEKGNG